jgi:hypothetical protein
VGKVKEIDLLASRSKRTDCQPGSPAEALVRELQSGAVIVQVEHRDTGELWVLLRNTDGISYRLRLKSGLGELNPDQLGIYAKALSGKGVRGPGRPRANEKRDTWLRGTVALYWAQGHPLKESAGKISAFEKAQIEAAEFGFDITVDRVRKIWEEGSEKPDLKSAVKGNPD